MHSWLKDFISPNSSAKTIAIVLLTCVNLVIFWDKGEKLIASRGIQAYYASFILIVIFYSVSHLLIIILCKLFAGFEKIWAYYKEFQHKKAGSKAFRHKVRKAIPQLPTAQIEILDQLSESERTLDLVKNGALYLENQNYITRLHKVSHSSFVFEINSVVKEELSNFHSDTRKRRLEEFAANITAEERVFLSQFFSDEISEGTFDSGKKMEPDIFWAGENMVRKDILQDISSKNPSVKAFRLKPDITDALENKVFHKKHVRRELYLDSNFILAPRNSGGGATGSR